MLEKYGPKYIIGTIEGEKAATITRNAGHLSQVPYAEASAWQPAYRSPYYTDSHKKFKVALRTFFDQVVIPEARENDKEGDYPSADVYQKSGEFGLLASRIGPGAWLKGRNLPGGVKAEEFDYFHELIAHEEMVL